MEITDVGTVTVCHHSGMPSATFSQWQTSSAFERSGFDLTKRYFANVESTAVLALP